MPMESRKQSHEVHDEADDQDGGDATVHWDTLAEAGAEQEQARSPDEDNWNALSNLRVATEVEGLDGSSDESREQKSRRRPSRDAPPPTRYPEDGNYSKSSLSFILDDHAASASGGNDDITSGNKQAAAVIARSRSTGDLTIETTSPVAMTSHDDFVPTAGANEGTSRTTSGKHQGTDGKRRARRPPSRICKHEGCEQYVVDQGLCVRHGGGKRCLAVGCTSRAKHQGRCWKHGGSTECKVPDCINRAKSRGFCWSHGGGTKCKADTCEKIAISNGLCWAHGGGKRCAVGGCMRQAYERTDNLCNNHYQERQRDVNATKRHRDDEEKPRAPSADF